MSEENKKDTLHDRVLAMRGETRKEGASGPEIPRAPRKCRISAEEFLKHAADLVAVIEGQPVVVHRKVFSSGSFGWYVSGKLEFMVNGQPIRCQISMSAIAIGSKPGQQVKEEI